MHPSDARFQGAKYFKFTDLYGKGPQDIIRTSETKSSLYRNNSNDISLRAYYNSDNFQFPSRIAYSLANTPHHSAHNIMPNITFPQHIQSDMVKSYNATTRLQVRAPQVQQY